MPKPQIMYIEYKGDGLEGEARIGLVAFSKTGRTLKYNGREFQGTSNNTRFCRS